MTPSDFIIGCDMDDTLTHLVKPWILYLNKQHGKDVNPDGELNWDLKVHYPDLTNEEIFAPLFDPEFWPHVDPLPDAVETVKKLIDEGFQFYVVTSSNYKTLASKFPEALFKHFPFIDRHRVITTYNKQLIRCDILIDDGPHNIVGPYRGLLMHAPHNHSFDEAAYSNVKRVYSWKEVYAEVHKSFDARRGSDLV